MSAIIVVRLPGVVLVVGLVVRKLVGRACGLTACLTGSGKAPPEAEREEREYDNTHGAVVALIPSEHHRRPRAGA